MPWANGKGSTVELLRVEREGRLILRLSRAMVAEDGAFSLFPGIERNLTVVSGPGFDLVGQGVRLSARPLVSVAFRGDVAIRAEGVLAPSEDLNVMAARGAPPARVWVQQSGETATGAIFALEAGQIGRIEVARYDLVVTTQMLHHDMPVIVVQADGL